jgi:carbamoyltransferase
MKNKKILGLWSGHDASFCTLNNGIVQMHTEAERHLRVKEPAYDAIKLFYEHDGDEEGIIGLATCHMDSGIKEHADSWKMISRENSNEPLPLYVCGHHAAHAANAFYSSNLQEAVIVTVDGGGIEDLTGFTVSATIWKGSLNKLEQLHAFPIQELNIGGVWSRCTRYIFRYESGWPQGHQAGTVMALAALGKSDKYLDDFRNFMRRDLSQVDARPPGHVKGMSAKDPRSPQHPFLKKWEDIAKSSDQDCWDMALALQKATEEMLKQIIEKAINLSGSKNICMTGGVALNSVAMGKIKEWFPEIENIFIPPVPYDGGLTIGAAQYAWHNILDNPRVEWHDNATPYLGTVYSHYDVMSAIEKYSDVVTCKSVTDDDVLKMLSEQMIVSVFNGRAESGRRALGNRSILADPRNPNMKDTVNHKVKHRQWFRPFAPSVIREAVKDIFTSDQDSPYMSFVLKFKDDVADKLPAIVHFDGTARLQTITKDDNPWYYNFIKKWGTVSGYPIILNTSFNDREPICETPEHAIKCFLGTEIDRLYFPEFNIVVQKK